MTKSDFLNLVTNRMKGETIETLAGKFESGDKSVGTVSTYLSALVADMRYEDARRVWSMFWEGLSAEKKTSLDIWPLIVQYTRDVYAADFKDLVALKSEFQSIVGVGAYSEKVYQLVYATVANACNNMVFEDRFDIHSINTLCDIVERTQCDTVSVLSTMLSMTYYAANRKLGKAVDCYCADIDRVSDTDRMSLTMLMNGVAYKYGRPKECKRALVEIRKVANRYQWNVENPMLQAMIQGL